MSRGGCGDAGTERRFPRVSGDEPADGGDGSEPWAVFPA